MTGLYPSTLEFALIGGGKLYCRVFSVELFLRLEIEVDLRLDLVYNLDIAVFDFVLFDLSYKSSFYILNFFILDIK